jgi:integron integrase
MQISEFIEKVDHAMRREHKARKTRESYLGWVNRYAAWLKREKGLYGETAEVKVSSYLGWLATREVGCSPRTQDQALNALVFAYKKGLGQPLVDMPAWVRPPDRERMPVWLSRGEFDALCRHLTGDCLELAQIMFGAGLRLNEALKLRVRDLHFEAGLIMVRGGKGDKDRTTCLPRTLSGVLQERLQRLYDLWEQDRAGGVPGVWLPDGVGLKFPNYGKDWPWQWVFPGRALSRDPESGIVRRHHVHEDTLAKSLKKAAVRARLTKRITVHTLRHSFATAFLEGGGCIHKLQKLLGHTSLETTQIYAHCVARFAADVVSPLDAMPSNVMRFPGAELAPMAERRVG